MPLLYRVTPPSQCRVHLATNVISMSSRFRRNRKGAGRPHKRCVGLVCEASAVAKSAARTEMHAARLVRSHPQRRWGAHATRWRAKNRRQNSERGSTPRECPDVFPDSVHLSPQVRGIPRLTSSSPKRNSASLASTVCGWTSSTTCTFLQYMVGWRVYLSPCDWDTVGTKCAGPRAHAPQLSFGAPLYGRGTHRAEVVSNETRDGGVFADVGPHLCEPFPFGPPRGRRTPRREWG